jgi:sugar phosphate permease
MIELLNHRTYAASCLWLFISAPLVGALLSSLVSTYLFKTEQEPATITSQIKK